MAWTPQTDEDEKDSGPQLTDAQWKAIGEDPNPPSFKQPLYDPEANASHPAIVRAGNITAGAAPDVQAPPTALPTVGQAMPNVVKPTSQQSIAAGATEHGMTPDQEAVAQYGKGKAAYEAGLPQVTAKPFTPEWAEQKEEELEYKKAHPLGSDVSAMPGVGGKILHGLGRAANIAGDILAPGLTMGIPGSDLNNRLQENHFQKEFTGALGNEETQEKIAGEKAGNELMTVTDPISGQPIQVQRRQWAPLAAATIKGNTAENVADINKAAKVETTQTRTDAQVAEQAGHDKVKLRALGFDEHGAPLPDDQLTKQQIGTRDLTTAHTKLLDAQAAYNKAKVDPNSPVTKMLLAGLQLRQAEFSNKVQEQGLIKPSGQSISRADAADAALHQLPDIEDAVRKNAKEFGPIIGRINSGEIQIGNASPAVQKFYSQLQSFYAQQPAIHGFRNAEFVKDFDTFIGNLNTNPESLIAGLEGLKPTLEAVSNEGRTMKHRIVEGAQGAATGGGGAAAAKPGANPF